MELSTKAGGFFIELFDSGLDTGWVFVFEAGFFWAYWGLIGAYWGFFGAYWDFFGAYWGFFLYWSATAPFEL